MAAYYTHQIHTHTMQNVVKERGKSASKRRQRMIGVLTKVPQTLLLVSHEYCIVLVIIIFMVSE